jgi:hypothetical protein
LSLSAGAEGFDSEGFRSSSPKAFDSEDFRISPSEDFRGSSSTSRSFK